VLSIGLASSWSFLERTLTIQAGRSLDGVTLQETLEHAQSGLWVRITDARVRADVRESFTFSTRRGRKDDGPSSSTTYYVSPITLASEVTHEEHLFRAKPTGPITLWSCAEWMRQNDEWDGNRMEVRGFLSPMPQNLHDALQKKLGPTPKRAPPPGAGAIPAAPGADGLTIPKVTAEDFAPPGQRKRRPAKTKAEDPPKVVEPPPTPLSVASNAWCVTLTQELDPEKVRQSSLVELIALLSFITFGALLFAGAAHSYDTHS
jgi:hypothetical protein